MQGFFCKLLVLALVSCAAWGKEPIDVKVEVLAKASKSWDGKVLPNYRTGTPEITILRISIPPQALVPMHMHPVINAGLLLKGELTVVTGENETLHLKAGDTIIEVVNKWHYGKNEGTETAEIVVFYAGVENAPLSIKK